MTSPHGARQLESFTPPTVTNVLERFGASVALRSRANYAKRLVAIVTKFLWRAGVVDATTLTAQDVERYLASMALAGRAVKTMRNHLGAINQFCQYFCDIGLTAANPCVAIRLAKPDLLVPRYLDDGELTVVLDLARTSGIWPEVCLAVSTGLRLGEMIRLQWADVHRDRRWLLVRLSKSHRPRTVPLSNSALDALTEQHHTSAQFAHVFPARRTFPGGWRYVDSPRHESWWLRAMHPIQDAVPKFRQHAGTGRAWHLLRHTFASRLAQAGVSLYKIAQWLGHSDIRTTQIYAHLQTGFDADIEAAGVDIATENKP